MTPTPGFAVQVYVANTINLSIPYGDSDAARPRGAGSGRSGSTRACRAARASLCDLDGRRYRYYLLWLTTLPPGMQSASIAELALFR